MDEIVCQYRQRKSECGWKFRNFLKNIVEVDYDRAYCLDAPDHLPLGGVKKTQTDILYTHTHTRSVGVALSSIR